MPISPETTFDRPCRARMVRDFLSLMNVSLVYDSIGWLHCAGSGMDELFAETFWQYHRRLSGYKKSRSNLSGNLDQVFPGLGRMTALLDCRTVAPVRGLFLIVGIVLTQINVANHVEVVMVDVKDFN